MEAASNTNNPKIPVSIAIFAISDDALSKLRLQTTVLFSSSGLIWPNAIPVVPGPEPNTAVLPLELIEFLTKLNVAEFES
jgi:hypothetical protein